MTCRLFNAWKCRFYLRSFSVEQSHQSEDSVAMQTTTSSSSTSANTRTAAINQSTPSLLFKLPLEVRMEIYSRLFTKTILHVEAICPFIVTELHVRVFPALERLSDAEKKYLSLLERSMQSGQGIAHSSMPDSRVLDLGIAYHLPAYLRCIIAPLLSPSNQYPPVRLAIVIMLTTARSEKNQHIPFR